MRAAGVVVVCFLLVFAGRVRVARAQPGQTVPSPAGAEASTTPAAPAFGIGADAHLSFGDFIRSNIGVRGELILTPNHSLVLRGGTGKVEWMDSEYDDPVYREWFVRVGYRVSSPHLFAGFELGHSWLRAHWDTVDQMPPHDGQWFGDTTATALAGFKLGPVDLGLDYTVGSQSRTAIGVFIGAGYRQH